MQVCLTSIGRMEEGRDFNMSDSQCEYRNNARLGTRELEQQQNIAAIDPSSESPTACRSPDVLTHTVAVDGPSPPPKP